MEDVLNEREVVRFLLDRGGRCTNFDLVSNFRGVLNDPRCQDAARLKFKDIINTVAIVGEFQNKKYIELKKEYGVNNGVQTFCEPESETSSMSSECSGGSYSSPLSQNFQPYWRYRLSTSKQILTPPSPEFDGSVHLSRDTSRPRSESTPSQGRISKEPLHPVGRSYVGDQIGALPAHGVRRCVRSEGLDHNPGSLCQSLSFQGQDQGHIQSRRFSTDSFVPPDRNMLRMNRSTNDLHRSEDQRSLLYVDNPPPTRSSHPRRHGVEIQRSDDVFPNYPPILSQARNTEDVFRRPEVEAHSRLAEPSLSRNVEILHGIYSKTPNRTINYTSSPPYHESPVHRPEIMSPNRIAFDTHSDFQNSDNLRNVARALFKDPVLTSRISPRKGNDTATETRDQVSRISPRKMNDLGTESRDPTKASRRKGNPHESESKDSIVNPRRVPDSSVESWNSASKRNPNLVDTEYTDPTITFNANSRKVIETESKDARLPRDVTNFLRTDASHEQHLLNLNCSQDPSSKGRPSSDDSLVSLSSEQNFSGFFPEQNSREVDQPETASSEEMPPPVPPTKKLEESADPAKVETREDAKEKVKGEEWTMASAGKVRDRVQHFDDMEKRRNTKRSHSPLTPDKENRILHHPKGLGTDDDVSISVIDSKLKREWFVKAAQCDYHALVGLLKKEPKLAAIKDIAMGYTALHWAAKQGDANIIKLIAGSYKVNPNIRSNGGYTPVHLAALHKHEMIVHLLTHTYGADSTIRDYSGKRADQYPDHYIRVIAGRKASEKRPLKLRERPLEKEVGNSFMRIGSLNLRKSRKSAVFASVRGRNWGSASELVNLTRLGNNASMRKKLHKSLQPTEKKSENDRKNDSDSDSTFGFASKKQNS